MELLTTDIIAIIIALLGACIVMVYTIADNVQLRRENSNLRRVISTMKATRYNTVTEKESR